MKHTEFDYLLNAFEAASHSSNPAANNYGRKRVALFEYVRGLEADVERLKRELYEANHG